MRKSRQTDTLRNHTRKSQIRRTVNNFKTLDNQVSKEVLPFHNKVIRKSITKIGSKNILGLCAYD